MALAVAVAPLAGQRDVVVATTPPLFTGVAGVAIARLNRAPLRARRPRSLAGRRRRASTRSRPACRCRRRGAARAQALPRGGRGRRRDAALLRAHRPRSAARAPATVLIPNGTLRALLRRRRERRRGSACRDDAFLVTFAGTLGIAQALPTRARQPRRLRERPRHVRVRRRRPDEGPLVRRARARGLDNVGLPPAGAAGARCRPVLAGERRAARAALGASDVRGRSCPRR